MFFLTGGVGLDNKVIDLIILEMHLLKDLYYEICKPRCIVWEQDLFQPFWYMFFHIYLKICHMALQCWIFLVAAY